MSSPGRRMRSMINFLFFIVLLGLAAVAARSVSTPPAASSSTVPASSPSLVIETPGGTATPNPTATTAPDWQLIVLDQAKGSSKLVSLDPATNVRKTVFTDADESAKIKQVGNLTSAGTEALVLMGNLAEEFGGALYTIDTAGGGKKSLLIDQFASPWPPAFSPDGKKIAYVFFSNAERESGFFLIVANRDGANKRELVHETAAITQPIFSPTGDEVAYVRAAADGGGNAIMAVKTAGGTPRQIAAFTDHVPYDLAWSSDGAIAFVDGTGAAASLFELARGGQKPTKLAIPAGAAARPAYAPDAKVLAVTVTATGSSSVILLDRATGKTQNLGSGSVVLGWRNGR